MKSFPLWSIHIIAHDVIRGSLWLHYWRVNLQFGRILLFVYAFFPYEKIRLANF